MRKAQLGNARQQRVGDVREFYLPAPSKGISERQSQFNGNPLYASTLVNFWPVRNGLMQAPGYTLWGSKPGIGTIHTVLVYNPASFWGVTSIGTYDLSAGGVFPASATGGSVLPVYGINFTNSAGNAFLVSAGWGVKIFDGASWTVPVITGPSDPTKLSYVWSFKRRLFFLSTAAGEETYAWYLPVDSIQGEAKKFPVGPNFTRGGYLVSGGAWTLDGGNGPDDYCFFVSSEGEVAIYEGIDPSSADSFALVGVFYLGKVGDAACWVKEGADVLISSAFGIFSLSKIVKGVVVTPAVAETSEIAEIWSRISNRRPFKLAYFTGMSMLVAYNSDACFAQNRETKAWTELPLYLAACFVQINLTIASSSTDLNFFFGRSGSLDGEVFRFGGNSANGAAISSYFNQIPFSLSGQGAGAVKLMKPVWQVVYTPAQAAALGFSAVCSIASELDSTSTVTQDWNVWQTLETVGENFTYSYNVSSLRMSARNTYDAMYYGAQIQYRLGSSSMP